MVFTAISDKGIAIEATVFVVEKDRDAIVPPLGYIMRIIHSNCTGNSRHEGDGSFLFIACQSDKWGNVLYSSLSFYSSQGLLMANLTREELDRFGGELIIWAESNRAEMHKR